MTAKPNVLAQAAAARLRDPACGEARLMWNQHERMHEVAVSETEALAAAAPLVDLCRKCPIVDDCRAWARVDKYTGIASGSAWWDGSEKPTSWVRGHPPRVRLAS